SGPTHVMRPSRAASAPRSTTPSAPPAPGTRAVASVTSRGVPVSTKSAGAIPSPAPASLPIELRPDRPPHAGRHDAIQVAAEPGDLFEQRGADEERGERGDDHQRLDLGGQLAVHQGLLKLILEVGHRAQSAHDRLCTDASRKVDDQPLEGLDAYAGKVILSQHIG